MRIYISIPISCRTIHEAEEHAERLRSELDGHGHKIITPFDVCKQQGKSYAYYMGRDIEALLKCDAIVLGNGWEHSNGCRLEMSAATIYGHYILYEEYLDQIDLSRMTYKINQQK